MQRCSINLSTMNTTHFIKHFRQKTLAIICACMLILAAGYTWLAYNQLHPNIAPSISTSLPSTHPLSPAQASTDFKQQLQDLWLSALSFSLAFTLLICAVLYRPLGNIERKINLQYDALEEACSQRTEALEISNEELQSFAYSVSHDLRGPLRAIDGFSLALFEDYHDKLGDDGKDYIQHICKSSQRMGSLIDSMLILSRVSQAELHYVEINLSTIAQETIAQLQSENPERNIQVSIAPNMVAFGDPSLLRQVIENLLSNAWKFTSTQKHPHISFRSLFENGQTIYEIKDNGVGFNQTYQKKLFTPFQRLHRKD